MNRKLPKDSAEFFQETGRRGGKIGGKRRVETKTMPPEERSERAKRAAAAWVEARRKRAPPWPTVIHNLEALRSPIACSSEALILADQLLNRLLGYARRGSRTRNDYYPRDLNWTADVLVRMEAGERNPLRPTGE